ncbi:MAG: DOMON domain-containing protein [Actinomycetota bacterium]
MKKSIPFIFLAVILCSLLIFSSCSKKSEDAAKQEILKGTSSAEDIVIDGIISDEEYPFKLEETSTGISLYWFNDESNLYIGLQSESKGWISIGLDPERVMKEANFIFLANVNDEIIVRDDFGTGNFSHSPDTELGGTEDITRYAGQSTEKGFSYEIVIPMDSGDQFDKKLAPGREYTVLLAINSTDTDFNKKHTARGKTSITLN